MKTMVIDGTRYREAKPPKNWASLPAMACTTCALHEKMEQCGMAIDRAADEAFGGDCVQRDVIYRAEIRSAKRDDPLQTKASSGA